MLEPCQAAPTWRAAWLLPCGAHPLHAQSLLLRTRVAMAAACMHAFNLTAHLACCAPLASCSCGTVQALTTVGCQAQLNDSLTAANASGSSPML